MKKTLRIAALFAATFFVPAQSAFCAEPDDADVAPAGVPAAAPKLDAENVGEFSAALGKLWNAPVETMLSAWNFNFPRWEKTEAANEKSRGAHSLRLSRTKIFGVPAEQLKIEDERGVPAKIEIMFFNKGDSAATQGFGYNSGKTNKEKAEFVKDAWREDAEAVARALAPLGKARPCSIGAGKLRRRAEMRAHGGNAFFLDAEKDEYVRIVIVPENRAAELTSSVGTDRVKGNFSKNAERRENGDVLIGNIPMINQGEKGYCVPATVERVLRYFGVKNPDMHEIAELAGTHVGGGTSMAALVKGLSPVLKRQKLGFSSAKMSFTKIRQCADKGIPMIWCMYSVPAYRERLEENTRERAGETDFSARAKKLAAMKKLDLSYTELREYSHVCLIIGYNAKTKEICVSDSWGRGAEEEWIRFDDALAVSQSAPLYILKN